MPPALPAGGTAALSGGSTAPFEVAVECVKAQGLPSRVERMEVSVHMPEGTTGTAADNLVHRAEAACTIANTLLASAKITTPTHDDGHASRRFDPAG